MSRYTALIDGNTGAYGVIFPDLPGCTAMGATIEQAMENAADAMREWAEMTEEMGISVPAPRPLETLRRDAEVIQALAEGATLASLAMVRVSGRSVKANLSLDAGILAAIDEEAKRRKLTRSDFVTFMAKSMLAA